MELLRTGIRATRRERLDVDVRLLCQLSSCTGGGRGCNRTAGDTGAVIAPGPLERECHDLVCFLGAGERCVRGPEDRIRLPQSRVSCHPGALRDAGLVTAEQHGKNGYHSLREDRLVPLGGRMLTEVFHDPVQLARHDFSLCG